MRCITGYFIKPGLFAIIIQQELYLPMSASKLVNIKFKTTTFQFKAATFICSLHASQ